MPDTYRNRMYLDEVVVTDFLPIMERLEKQERDRLTQFYVDVIRRKPLKKILDLEQYAKNKIYGITGGKSVKKGQHDYPPEDMVLINNWKTILRLIRSVLYAEMFH